MNNFLVKINKKKTLFRCGGIFLILAYLLLSSGCSSLRPTQSGALGDYSQMKSGKDECRREFLKLNVDWAQYDTVFIESVKFNVDDCQEKNLTQKDIEQIKQHLKKALQFKIGKDRSIVAERCPGTLIVRATVTGINESSPLVNVLSTAAVFIPIDSGGIVIESEVRDATTDTQLYAISYAENGKPWQFADCFSRFGHAESAMEKFADELAKKITPTDVSL